MELEYSAEQLMLRDSVDRFVRDRYGLEIRRGLLAGRVTRSADHWRQYAELGWLAVPFSELHGGLDGRLIDVAIIMEGFGRGLVLDPYLPTILAGRLIARFGSEMQRRRYLVPAIEGKMAIALAFVEHQARYDLSDCATSAVFHKSSNEFTIRGRKSVVLGGDTAEAFVIVARTSDSGKKHEGLSLFILEKDQHRLAVRPYRLHDGLGAADLELQDVTAGSDTLLGELGAAYSALDQTVDYGTACIMAEAVGAMGALCDATLDYLKTRKQFGKPLAANQALQHRMVDMFIALEEARSSALFGALSGEHPDDDARRKGVSLAKIEINRTSTKIGQEAVQLHGAMGVTDELAVSHYFKRLTAIAATFGDSAWHVHRIGRLSQAPVLNQ